MKTACFSYPFGLSEVEAPHRAERDAFAFAQARPSTSLRANGDDGEMLA